MNKQRALKVALNCPKPFDHCLTTVEGEPRKKFTARQRLAILRQWDSTRNGMDVSRHYGIHPMTLYRCKKRLEQGAAQFLKGTRARPNPEVKELQTESQKLKDTVILLGQELMLLKKISLG